jgi:hypothetical protein
VLGRIVEEEKQRGIFGKEETETLHRRGKRNDTCFICGTSHERLELDTLPWIIALYISNQIKKKVTAIM